MVFSSISFLFFLFPIFFICDVLFVKKTIYRNILLIVFSLLFYTWGEGKNVFLLILLAVINYVSGILLYKASGRGRSIALGLAISINISCLVYFKYLAWICSNLACFIPFLGEIQNQVLPLGISFFTFHGISYLVDIYRNKISEKPTPVSFFTYFFMFPHLVAGPIVRYGQVCTDIALRQPNRELFIYGMARFLVGINKKVLIANMVAPVADVAFSVPAAQLTFIDAWLGVVAYTIQIYFDFSGYSDMAIGLAAMAGIRFEENFLTPYRSRSISEFWRRWHISLSTWLRDYLYIPLGGSRIRAVITYRNLFLVFIICGLWHGAEFTFLVWGVWHGILLIIERLGLQSWLEKRPLWLQRSYCLLFVMIGWVFFRANNLTQSGEYLSALITVHSISGSIIPLGAVNIVAMLAGIFIALFPVKYFESGSSHTVQYPTIAYITNSFLVLISFAVLYSGARNPFIYFNF